MCRKSVCAIGVVLFLAFAGRASAELIGWWTFDEGAGTVAADSSGKAHDGTLQGDPEWVPGKRGSGALGFDGVNDIVQVNEDSLLDIDSALTVAAWVKLNNLSTFYFILVKAPSGTAPSNYPGNYEFRIAATTGVVQFGHQTSQGTDFVFYDSTSAIKANRWYHVAVTFVKGGTVKFYIDGSPAGSLPQSANFGVLNDEPVRIGGRKDSYSFFSGVLDDVRLYNHALKDAEIKKVAARPKAYDPQPPDGAIGVSQPLLQWTPGTFAQWHEVYFGTSPELGQADFRARQPQMVTMYYHMAGLEPGKAYYWRVDEVEPNQAVQTGDVWSFTATPTTAWSPMPADGARYQDPNTDLTWSAGQNAMKHEVYFSMNQDDVVSGAAAASKGSPSVTRLELPLLPLETTYYWRVDEIDIMGSKKVGDVWSFTTTIPGLGAAKRELWLNGSTGTAVSDLTDDSRYPGAPTDVNEMPDFESPANIADNYGGKLSAWLYVPLAGDYTFWVASDNNSQLFLGADPDSAKVIASVSGWTNAGEWDKFASQKSKPITLEAGRYYLMALWKDGDGGDNCAAAWQGPGIPTRQLIAGSYLMPFEALWAYGPRPRNDANETTQTPELKWTAGVKAKAHQVYFSDDVNAVADGTPGSAAYRGEQALDDTSFDPGALEFGKTYYWRVDEVSTTDPDSPWTGTVWRFTTANFIVVDDFEDYVDDVEGRIFQTWIDGWGYTEPAPGNPGNGTSSTVGYTSPPFAETSIVHGGRQAMPFDYNNIIQPYYSETDRTWTVAQNWTLNGMDTLSLWFQGYPVKFLDDGTTITMSAAGDDIWNAADAFRFAYKRLSGDGSITAKVLSIVQTDVWAKAGVMIRETLTPGSANAANVVSAASGVAFQWRPFTDDVSANVAQTGLKAPYWVRLTRTGNTFKAEASADGKTWTSVGTDAAASSHDVILASSIYIGLCVTSHNTNPKIATTGVFSDIKTTGGVSGQWQVADIGMVHPGNDPAQMYVALQDSAGKLAVVNHPDLNAVLTTTWTEWQIPLSQFTGVNTKAIKKMYIGVGDRKAPKADGTGRLFIDDIRAVKPAAVGQ